ncbi:MAG: poly-gamma-glutamate system protein [Calditrichota bacterium]
MTIVFLALYYWAENSVVKVRPGDYQDKMVAAQIMRHSLETLEKYRLPAVDRVQTGDVIDPLVYTMLGEKDSPITTDEGRIEDKITVLNPNFAAAVVDLLHKAHINQGDTIAVLATGSMPGANLAVYSAAKALALHPIIITSVSSSWWGANQPDFTWLDMEKVLLDQGEFDFRSIAASAGGSDDHGGLRLSALGRQMITEAIQRNDVVHIEQGSLSANIRGRIELFERQTALINYKVVVNIGGGVAALGHRENFNLIPSGYNSQLPPQNYPGRGVIHAFAEAGVPVIHIANVANIAQNYNLPVAQLPVPREGVGLVFERKKYNLTSAVIALALMFLILALVKWFDRQHYRWREEKVDKNTI